MGRRPALLAGLLLAVLATAACTEDALTGPGPEGSRGAETVEIVLGPEEMALWRDTTFGGYALPVDAGFLTIADGEEIRARSLLRFRTVPDSITVDSVRRPVAEYTSATVRLAVDTAASTVPEGGATVRLVGIREDWDAEEVSWTRAAEGRPWETPGGDLGRELAAMELSGPADSALAEGVELPVAAGVVDSLLRDWSRNEGGRGAALLVDGDGAATRLRFQTLQIGMGIRPPTTETPLEVQVNSVLPNDPSTFIQDPPPPGPSGDLRLGGLPAHRIYLSFLPPDSAGGVPLRRATVNRAELLFRPRSAPEAPYRLGVEATSSLVELVSDPFEAGPRTPLVSGLGRRPLVPDSLAAGRPLRFLFTGLMSRWAAEPDSFGVFHLGVRLEPDAQDPGFWEFGGADAPAGLRPTIRLLVTPATTFDLP